MFQKLRGLSKDLAIYGVGDVAVSVAGFLLLPIYVRFLTPGDYGVLGLLGSVEVIAKIFFRWGLDGSFMRLMYESDTGEARQRLASTIFFFLLLLNGVLLTASLLLAPALAAGLFDGGSLLPLQLTLVNTFVIAFTFLPFHILRIDRRAVTFGALSLGRSVSTLLLRIVLVVGFGYGVLGIVVADLVVSAVLLVVLSRWFVPLIRPVFSAVLLRHALRFGVPRVPHAAAQQIVAVADKFILASFVPLRQLGIYTMGVSFGLTLKLFLSAFEYAWAPFYYANSRQPDAKALFAGTTTYGFGILVLLTAGLSAVAGDLLLLVVGPDYATAGPIVAWTAVGVLFQGVYLLTSIGLNITKRTEFYPVATVPAAGLNVAANLLLVPAFGIIAAAWVNAASYALQAAIAYRCSQSVYPVRYEHGRLLRVTLAGAIAYAVGAGLPALPPAAGVLARGTAVVAAFAAGLWLSGFFSDEELRRFDAIRARRRGPGAAGPAGSDRPQEPSAELAGAVLPAPEDRSQR